MSHDVERESEFEKRTRALFEASVESLDDRTRSRLNQARQAALAELNARRTPAWLRMGMPLAGVTAAAVLAVWMALSPGMRDGELQETGWPVDDLDIVADVASFDLIEDVEFYAWVAAQTSQANGNSG